MITYNVKMYNEDRKKRFIRDYTGNLNTSKLAERLFRVTALYEVEWDSDICVQNVDRLRCAINTVFDSNYANRWMSLIVLREYIKWCKAMGIQGVNDDIFSISFPELDDIRLEMVANPVQLQSFLNDIFEPESEHMVDNTYRCWYWMAFGGIPQQDALKVETDDIDFPHMNIKYNGIEAPIYREAVPAFWNAVSLSSFKYKHPNYDIVDRDRVSGKTVLRGIRGTDERNILHVSKIIKRFNMAAIKKGKTNLELKYSRVQRSGLYYRVYELEKIGVPVNLSTFSENAFGTKVNKQKNLVINDYFLWKLAFTE